MMPQEFKDLTDLVQANRILSLFKFPQKTQTYPGAFRKLDLIKPGLFS